MSDLRDLVRHVIGRFGRPVDHTQTRATDETVTGIDNRLHLIEREQNEIEARLRRLEAQSWRD